jgi:protein PhnA
VDANGNALHDGDAVTLIKDLKVKGSSATLKAGTKVKKIRIVDPDQNAGHDIDAKAGGMAVLIRGKFVKKA